jgi:predicted nuclease of predicted toxin-antitoxin system
MPGVCRGPGTPADGHPRVNLLFDQNLSHWLCGELADLFPGSVHVRDVGLREAADSTIWAYAVQRGFAIVTKDADFRQRSFLQGHPPKVIWIAIGNCSTRAIAGLLRRRALEIEGFLADEQKSFLALR